MKNGYPFEKFYKAVDTLAKSPRPLQQRIADAFAYNLYALLEHPGILDDAIEAKLKEHQGAWTAIDDAGAEGTISAWASRLSDDEAMEIAGWIVERAFELHRQF